MLSCAIMLIIYAGIIFNLHENKFHTAQTFNKKYLTNYRATNVTHKHVIHEVDFKHTEHKKGNVQTISGVVTV